MVFGLLLLVALAPLVGCEKKSLKITEQEILLAQKTWGEGVVLIGKTYTDKGDYRKTTEDFVDTMYDYAAGPVLFKPTKAYKQPFRLTKQGAISYFIGGDTNFPEDKGFALQPWTKVRFENAQMFISRKKDYAVAMGNYYFTPAKGDEVKVEYSIGYVKGKDGTLKINLQHSSLPYSP